MSGGADLYELARSCRVVGRDTALIGKLEVTAQQLAEPAPTVSWLADQLYVHCYVRPVPRARHPADLVAERDFRTSLSAANSGLGTWEGGWRLADDAARWRAAAPVQVVHHGVTFVASSDRVRPGSGSWTAGSLCRVRVPKERRDLHPGYYFLLGDAPWPGVEEDARDLVRVYWNVRPDGAAAWVAAVSAELNRRDVPFRAKVRDSLDSHGRADSALVYLPRAVLAAALDGLAPVLGRVAGQLDDQVPMFTRAVAPGVAMATDPGNGLSFGQHRCQLAADGLLDHHDRGLPDTAEARYGSIADAFTAADLDPARPYLAPGEPDGYAPFAPPGRPARTLASTRAGAHGTLTPGRYLDAATHVGRSLCDAAYWDRSVDRCAWIGRVLDLTALAHRRSPRPAAATLEWRLYDGHAGVALFLAELYARTGDQRFWRTARGAIRTALHRLAAADEEPSGGLHTGLGGVLLVARRLAVAGDGAVVADLDAELARVVAAGEPEQDVTDGHAGLVLALLGADGPSPLVGGGRADELAVGAGRALLASSASPPRLTGFAHGAAGFGAALLRLYGHTRAPEFLDAGRAVLDWEDGTFDEAEGRWPDLRERPAGWAAGTRDVRSAATWCNGAAGIALSRLSAMADDPDRGPAHERSVGTALALVRAALAVSAGPDDDTSLCHGAAGLAETLLVAGTMLAEPRWVDEARSAADILLHGAWSPDRLTDHAHKDPGLMLGASGIGHQLLRLHAPDAVPGILLPRSTSRSVVLQDDGEPSPSRWPVDESARAADESLVRTRLPSSCQPPDSLTPD